MRLRRGRAHSRSAANRSAYCEPAAPPLYSALPISASLLSLLALTGFAFFGVATAIFGFLSYVRNVKPEARFVYYLVRARARAPPSRRVALPCSTSLTHLPLFPLYR